MLRSLNTGVNAMRQFQEQLDVIGNNIANVNTTAFKSARVDFEEAFSQTLQQSAPGSANSSQTPAMQVGTGTLVGAIKNQFTQGSITRTGVQTDLAIAGDGFFIVSDPGSGEKYATRAGDFSLDSNGYLVTNSGMRLQGYSDSGLTTIGDVRIDATGAPQTADPTATVVAFSIGRDGKINVRLSDGTEFVRGQILLQQFSNPNGLVKEGNNLYSGIAAAGPLPAMVAPGSAGLGKVESGALELSNVDLANEFSSLITAQRAFQASARVISTSDEILQELVNLKR
ncbi:MAG: flagellar hook-basal body complex protein [Verrucomicrobiia bacterium]|jgi:flagellar hook protein FlgE